MRVAGAIKVIVLTLQQLSATFVVVLLALLGIYTRKVCALKAVGT